MHTVKETAAIMNLTEHTLRYYTDKGLVPMVKRDKNNNRLFDEECLNWLTAIKCLRECGMSIEAIKEYCDLCLEGDSTIERRYRIMLEQKAAADARLEEAKTRVAYLERKLEKYRDTLNHQLPDGMNPGNWATKTAG